MNQFSAIVGPAGGQVASVAYHPLDSSIAYASTSAGFYRSTDGGQSWRLVSEQFLMGAQSIAVHPSHPNRVFVAEWERWLQSSDDSGATLNRRVGFDDARNLTEVRYSSDGSMLYAQTSLRIYRSSDDGATWEAGGLIPPAATMGITTMAVDPMNPQHLYVTVIPGVGLQSFDAGASWQSWTIPAVYDPNSPNTAYMVIGNGRIWLAIPTGVWFTDNGGMSWTKASSSSAYTLALDPHNPAIIYAGTGTTIERSTDNGAHWSSITGGARPGVIQSIAIDPANSNRLLVGGYAGIYGSLDGGNTWVERSSGINAMSPTSLTSSAASGRIYLTTSTAGIHALAGAQHGAIASVSQGNEQLNFLSASFHNVFVQPGSPDRLSLPANGQVARSMDGGITWGVTFNAAFATDPIIKVIGTSTDGQAQLALSPARLYRSNDSGSHWNPQANPANYYFTATATAAASNPQIVYVLAMGGGSNGTATLMKSVDGGGAWSPVATFPDAQVNSILVDPRSADTVYLGVGASAAPNVFKSVDGGTSWKAMFTPRGDYPIATMAIDPQTPDIIYVAGGDGTWRSANGGQDWQQLTHEETAWFWYVTAMAVDPQAPHTLVVGLTHGMQEISIEPDLSVTASALPTTIRAGESTTYKYQVKNAGPFDATGVHATITLPKGASATKATSAGGTCAMSGTIASCAFSLLRTDAVAEIVITSTQPSPGYFDIVTSVAGDQPDNVTSNNSATTSIEVRGVADLSLTLTAPPKVTPGSTIDYSLAVRNDGPNDATSVAVTFDLGGGLAPASASATNGACTVTAARVTCQLAVLASNASSTISIVSAATVANGSYSGSASIQAETVDVNSANNVATVMTTAPAPEKEGGGGSFDFLLLTLLATPMVYRLGKLGACCVD